MQSSLILRRMRTLGPFVAVALCLDAPPASADSNRLPGAYVARPLVLPKATLRIDGGPRWPDPDAMYKHIVLRNGPNFAFLNPGISAGVARDFELGGVLPLQVAPDLQLEDPRFYVLYRFTDGSVQAGVFGQVRPGIRGPSSMIAGVPLFARLGSVARLETGGFVRVRGGGDAHLDVMVPFMVAFQPSNQFFLGPESGVYFYNVSEDNSGENIPLGLFAGYTLISSGVIGDLVGRLRMIDVRDGMDAFEVLLGAELFFDL